MIDVFKDTKSLIEKNSHDIIHSLNKPELDNTEDNDYFTIFYENLMKVREDKRDICVREIKKNILSLKEKN